MNNKEFAKIKIGLASPETIEKWSYGEVTKPETINYRTLKPEREGLFCEKIFGPTKDWECYCGKYKKVRYLGKKCEKCGVEITTKKVRRERMGHIDLAAPVSHIWYFKAIPSRMGLLLDISPKQLEKVLYFASYIITDVKNPPADFTWEKKQVITEDEYRGIIEKYGKDVMEVGMGAEAIHKLLAEMDLEKESEALKDELSRTDLKSGTSQKRTRIVKRLEVVEAFRLSGNKPEWMILSKLPVIPPEIRPMVQLDGGRFATSDLNDLYRRVINRNNRLKKLLEMKAPEIIIKNEKRMLQEAVDALIDNGRRGRPVTGPNNRALKSLSEMLRGKQGRFRQNLLGKRVDYSGRSVIVVGPELKIYQCGLPKEMALELFKPFVMKRLVETGKSANIKDAKKKVEHQMTEVWDALEVVIKEHPVLLNRAPTLHRLSIQAFEPILVEGRAIKLHPLVCSAFNADFDGDQMPVHVPLSSEAQAEARFLMLSANNLLKPANGRAVAVPTQDMVLGSYYLTYEKKGEKGEGNVYRDFNEANMAYENGYLGLHAAIKIRAEREFNGQKVTGLVSCTLGRFIFNSVIPQNLHFVERNTLEDAFVLEVNHVVKKDDLGNIIDASIKYCGIARTAKLLDDIKAMGFKYSTKGAITISVSDMTVPPAKKDILAKADEKVEYITKLYRKGLATDEERRSEVIKTWEVATNDVAKALQDNLDKFNPIFMMADSGARGSIKQIRQLAGMRGLMATASGRTLEIPIKANFREGLTILEYFTAARGARKGLADTALRTADSGYLTRRLVDVAQQVIIRQIDCGDTRGAYITEIREGNELIESLKVRIVGRYIIGDFVDKDGNVLAHDGDLITEEQSIAIEKAVNKMSDEEKQSFEGIHIRSILNCRSKHGICAHCYGADMSSGKQVNIGEAVGILAAQSIGEPGTQLTMRTFHTGGIAGGDITQGLPRVEELFEARRPKKTAILAEIDGRVIIDNTKKNRLIIRNDTTGEEKSYPVAMSARILAESGDYVVKGQRMTEGTLFPTDVARIQGMDAVYSYIIREVQKVYCLQSVDISDKHIEVIARQMSRRARVDDAGSTKLIAGAVVDVSEVITANEEIEARLAAGEAGLAPATYTSILQGITKASLSTESFLSAASFQETTKVLTEAAIQGKVDPLLGLKENVIIGKLIPAGTGLDIYRDIEVKPNDVIGAASNTEQF